MITEDLIEDDEPPEWHRKVLEERLEEAEQSSEPGIPWEVIRAELIRKYKLQSFD